MRIHLVHIAFHHFKLILLLRIRHNVGYEHIVGVQVRGYFFQKFAPVIGRVHVFLHAENNLRSIIPQFGPYHILVNSPESPLCIGPIAIGTETADHAALRYHIRGISVPAQGSIQREAGHPFLIIVGRTLAQHHIIAGRDIIPHRHCRKRTSGIFLHAKYPRISSGSVYYTHRTTDGILHSQRVIGIIAAHRQAPIRQGGHFNRRLPFELLQDAQVFVRTRHAAVPAFTALNH